MTADFLPQTLSVIGLGKLGAPMVAFLSAKGFNVIGIDSNDEQIGLLESGRSKTYEPRLNELLAENRARIKYSSDISEAVKNSSVSFIIVPTPSGPDGLFSLDYVLRACSSIAESLKSKNDYHLIVLTSTVLPQNSESHIIPVIESISGKVCGRDFGFCYNPEFIALGSVMHDLFHPSFTMIGEFDKRSGNLLEQLYRNLLEEEKPIIRMNLVNAELAKISLNTFITTKISFANMLGEICENLPGSDVETISKTLGSDPRISPLYLKGGLGYGGPCFPRDTVAFAKMAEQLGVKASLVQATEETNKTQNKRLAAMVSNRVSKDDTIGILGLSYKPNTSVTEESQGVYLAEALVASGQKVLVFDPSGTHSAKKYLDDRVIYAKSLEECITASDVLVITTPWQEFAGITAAMLQKSKCRMIIDCWRILNADHLKSVVEVYQLGIGYKACIEQLTFQK